MDIETATRLLTIMSIGVFAPQALGFMLWRIVRRQSLWRRILLVLGPSVVAFGLQWGFWALDARHLEQQGIRPCGLFGVAMIVMTVGSFLANLPLSALLQFIVFPRIMREAASA